MPKKVVTLSVEIEVYASNNMAAAARAKETLPPELQEHARFQRIEGKREANIRRKREVAEDAEDAKFLQVTLR